MNASHLYHLNNPIASPKCLNYLSLLNMCGPLCFFSILLSFVSGEDTQDRTDRVMLTPWVKFLWEAYRNVLELLRNNARVEKLYHDTAQQGEKELKNCSSTWF